ncbi:cupin domain-containing protein [Pararhodobacter zhoushanensis]|uniref:cupin domain-containing protein n=1 Tax=Pararhodobacter zhoushanensis TaxID=2479545 RepID=UPI0013DF43A4|nr:cupin domain-containing protein [Pararhodobacter zhoushanensis]
MKDTAAAPSPADFVRAIAPITPETFFAEYFEKKHLVVRRQDPAYYADLLTVADIDRVLTQTMVGGDEMQLVKLGKALEADDYVMPSGFIDPVRVVRHFDEGSTMVLPGLQKRVPALAAYCRALETVFSCDLQTNIYFTPDNAQGFKTHYDSHDVIVLQVHGSKTWNIYESPLKLPLRSQAFKPEGFEAGALIDSFTLHAGDMAYVPRGVVHDARATDEISLHITTGLLAPRWIDLLVEAVSELALEDPAFRHSVPPGYANEGFERAEARTVFQNLLTRAMAGIDPDRTLDGFAHEYRRRRVPVVPGQLFQLFESEAIEPGTPVQRRPDLIYAIKVDGDEVALSVYGAEIVFPAHVEGALREALLLPDFVVGDLKADLDEAGQAVMMRRLVREGVFAIAG